LSRQIWFPSYSYFGRAPPGRAIRFKSSHFLRQAPGFPLLSLTQTGKQEEFRLFHILPFICFSHPRNDKRKKSKSSLFTLNSSLLTLYSQSSLKNKTRSRQLRFIKQIGLNCISPCKAHFRRITYFFAY
jgi:hypothetical protein